MMLNYLNFCLSVKLLMSLSILKEIFAEYSNGGCRFFSFSTLNISCHSLLTCRISDEISAANLMGFPLYVVCCFSLAAFNILSFFLISLSLININVINISMCFPLGLTCKGLSVLLGLE